MSSAWLVEAPLWLALVIAPFTAGTLDPGPGLWLSCLAWTALLFRGLLPGLPPLRRPRGAWLVGLFLLLALVSVPGSANRGATVLQVVLLVSYACLWWLAADSAARGGGGRLVAAILVGAFLAGTLGLREYLFSVRGGDLGWRAFGQFANPNFFAGFLAPSLLLVLGSAFLAPREFKPWMWTLALGFVTAAVGGALLATGSRGGLLSFGVGLAALVLFAALRGLGRDRAAWLRLGVLLAVLAAISLATSGAIRGRQTGGSYTLLPPELCPEMRMAAAEESSQFRILTWKGALAMGRKRPVTGWGTGAFETSFEPHAIASYTRHAHSSYLQVLAEQGFLAPVALLLLGLYAVVNGVRLPREPEWTWLPGAGAAVVAAGVHNVFDSLLYVPAIALLTWSLLGLILASPATEREKAADADAEAAGGAAQPDRKGRGPGSALRREPETKAAATPASPRNLGRTVGAGVAAVGLLVTGSQAFGCALLAVGRHELAQRNPTEAVEALNTAAALLPLDHRVADEQRRAYTALGQWDQAIAAGLSAVRFAPDRAAGYDFLAVLRNYQQRPDMALETYREGLRHTPQNVHLLYSVAELLQRQGERDRSLAAYRKIVAVEDSPAGQVRALGEVREYRFARARVILANTAEREGRPDEAFEHRRRAACLLAERRRLHDDNPVSYMFGAPWAAQTERDLRSEEEFLWKQLAREYRSRGDDRRAELSEEMAAGMEEARRRLEKIISDYSGVMAN